MHYISLILAFILGLISVTESSLGHATTLKVPHTFMDSGQWTKLERQIDNTNDHVILIWTGIGGANRVAQSFIKYVQKHQSKLTFKAISYSESWHAQVLCFAKNVEFTKDAKLVFHSGYYFNGYKNVFNPVNDVYSKLSPCSMYLNKNDIHKIAYQRVRIEVYKDGHKKILSDWPINRR